MKILDSINKITEETLSHLKVASNFKTTQELVILYVKGLLSRAERKNSWQLSEMLGEKTPYRFQHLLYSGKINLRALQEKLSSQSINSLGSHGILTIDDTGFLKKGNKSAGVQRQYTGTAGRIENCQIGTFMGYATDKGHVLLDSRLYIPESWSQDRERCNKAGIPADVTYVKKPLQAIEMYKSFKSQGHFASWVTADEAFGKDSDFVSALEQELQPYVLSVPKTCTIRCGDLKLKKTVEFYGGQAPIEQWKRLSAGKGTKGERYYDWLCIKRNEIGVPSGYEKYLLVRRSIDTGELAYYIVFCPLGTQIEEIVRVAGTRWTVEECFETSKGCVGLDQYEVRSYQGWNKHILFSMWALFILVYLKNEMNKLESENSPEKDEVIDEVIQNEEQEVKKNSTGMAEFKKKRDLCVNILK